MNKKTLKILTLGTLFALCSCNGLANTSSSNEPQSTPISSSTPLAEYTVTWVVDGETSTETYLEGETPVYKYGTEKEADAVYTYTFIGWDKEIVPVVADVTYTAVYEKDYVDYVVTWVVDGVETQEAYHYNDMPSYKDGTPEKEGNAQYSYTFTGWSPELVAVTANATYTATFEQSINEYEVTWNVEGVETKETYAYGETPVYPGETPTKEKDAQYTYTFTGWDKDIAEVTGDVTYTAVFESNVNTYTITWVAGDAGETTEEYEYGETPTYKGSTDKTSDKYVYTFTGWDSELTSVTGDKTYVAQYSQEIKKFDINFLAEDGTKLDSCVVEYDGVPVYNGVTPTKTSDDADFYYEFAGWTNKATGKTYGINELPQAIEPTDYVAHFDRLGIPCDLSYKLLNIDGTEIKTGTAQFGYQSIYKLDAPEVEGKVPMTDYVKGYTEKENEVVTIYYSDVDVWDGTTVSTSLSGEGTEADPYLITSGADLAYFRDKVNANNVFTDKYFKLTKSIDLNDAENFVIGINGIDPSAITEENPRIAFDGYLDGNHCSIRGIKVNKTDSYTGLFAALNDNGTIANLATYGTTFGGTYTGGVVGRSFGKLINVMNYVEVTQNGGNAAGGIAGGITSKAVIDGCINYATIINTGSNNKTAGITGLGEGKTLNCVNFGTINANQFVGGIVGEAYPAGYVENVINYADITGKGPSVGGCIGQSKSPEIKDLTNYGDVVGTQRVGGVVGNNEKVEANGTNLTNYGNVSNTKGSAWTGGVWGCLFKGTLTNCVNYGNVDAEGGSAGGILGVVGTNGVVTLDNCTNYGDVKATSKWVGGILGSPVKENNGTITIKNSTNNGDITGTTDIGGIAGYLYDGTVENCVNTGTITATATGGLTGDIVGNDVKSA